MTTASAELLETVTPEGLRARADMIRNKLDDNGSTARHLELAADMIAALTRAVQPASNPASNPAADGGAVERVRDAATKWVGVTRANVRGEADFSEVTAAYEEFEAALAALSPPSQPAADAEVEAVAVELDSIAAGDRDNQPGMVWTGAKQAAALLRRLAAERAAPAAGDVERVAAALCKESFRIEPRKWPMHLDDAKRAIATLAAPAPDAVAVPKEMIEMVIGRIDHVHNWLAGWQHFEQCDHLLLARKALDRARSAAQRGK
jgi:hypothetical protein